MKKKQYRLSPECNILTTISIRKMDLPDIPDVEEIRQGKKFVLDNSSHWFIINPTIKAFLKAFSKPTTLEQVIYKFSQKANCKPEEIEGTLTNFLESMLDKNFIVEYSKSNKRKKGTSRHYFKKNQIIGTYKIEECIFEKSRLKIYLAENLNDQSKVAIKALSLPAHLPDKKIASVKKSFSQEFQLMIEVGQHKNICQCYEYTEQEPHYYGVLEYIDGHGLRNYIRKEKPTIEERIDLITQICSAFDFLHSKKILHGDIHLSNFIVENITKTVKLIDFNLSNRELPNEHEIIREGGVYQYIPPEKIDGRSFHLVNSRSDYCSEVFQLGVVFYYILYQKMPFDDFTWKSLTNKIKNDDPEFHDKTNEGGIIPGFIIEFTKKCLQKEPADRYASGFVMKQEWNKHLKTNAQPIIANEHAVTVH